MAIDNVPEVSVHFAQGAEAPKRMNTIQYHTQMPRMIKDLSSIPALDMGISPDQTSAAVKFMQEALNRLYKNKAAGEDGKPSDAFVSRVNQFIKDHAGTLQPIAGIKDISGAHLAALIKNQQKGYLGSENDSANRLLSETLRNINNDRMKQWGGRFDPFPSKPMDIKVSGTNNHYNATTNTLLLG